uniref:Uncharacterized protein n=1 Tax=Timema cristinae TaxID=61476 RepID=A0A7R9CSN1_TIMCR|nr:unnamed protein product [Timema cristinae]
MLLVALLVSLVGLQSLGAPSYTSNMQSLEDTDYVSSEDTESPWVGEEYSEDNNALYRTKKYKESTHFVNADTSEEDEVDGNGNNFIRLGRSVEVQDDDAPKHERGSSDESFMWLDRGKPENFLRFGRERPGNFFRLGRAKSSSNLLKFGGADKDSFLRLGRNKDSNVVRFGRLGRDKDSNVVRFGRGKPDSYIRLGREPNENSSVDPINEFVELVKEPEYTLETDSDAVRVAKSGRLEGEFKRLGKASLPVIELPSTGEESIGDDFLPIPSQANEALSKDLGMEDFNYRFLRFRRNGNGKSVRFGRGKLADSNFIRLGRSGGDIIDDGFEQVGRTGKDVRKLNMLQLERSIPEEDLIRLGRDTEYVHEPTEAQFTTSHNVTGDTSHVNRRRRSLTSEIPPMIVAYSDIDQKAEYKRSRLLDGETGNPHFMPLSASLSSYILAPELSLLPESAQVDVKRDKSYDRRVFICLEVLASCVKRIEVNPIREKHKTCWASLAERAVAAESSFRNWRTTGEYSTSLFVITGQLSTNLTLLCFTMAQFHSVFSDGSIILPRLLEEYKDRPEELDINCVDPLNRSALISAIENENIELIRLLLDYNIKVKASTHLLWGRG